MWHVHLEPVVVTSQHEKQIFIPTYIVKNILSATKNTTGYLERVWDTCKFTAQPKYVCSEGNSFILRSMRILKTWKNDNDTPLSVQYLIREEEGCPDQ